MEQFTSRTIAKLFDDVSAALDEVQSIRTRTVKVMRFLDKIHELGWKLSPGEPIAVAVRREEDAALEPEGAEL